MFAELENENRTKGGGKREEKRRLPILGLTPLSPPILIEDRKPRRPLKIRNLAAPSTKPYFIR